MSMVEIFYQQHSDIVTNNFRSFLENEVYIDLIFMCRNNKKVGAHRMVMGCLSKFLSQLLIDNQQETRDETIYVYVPDIRAKIMKYILQFIYTGKVMINKEDLSEFNQDLILLGMPMSVITSLDKNQPITSQMTNKNSDIAKPSPSYVASTDNFVSQSNLAITNVQSLNNGITSSTDTSNQVISEIPSYLNQSNQMIALNNQENVINPFPANYNVHSVMPVSSSVTGNPPSTEPSNSLSNKPEIGSITILRKRRKENEREAKVPKISADQCIDLAESDDDSDVITIS